MKSWRTIELLNYIDQQMTDTEASLMKVPDGVKKIIIAGDRYRSHYNEEGILVMGIFDFLLDRTIPHS
ncbi:MAG: hypothetical protein IJT28_08945 [Bacteroidaceae bacterium]|nr:hypothetical protein [Bacteroidaceae bacterium]MBR6893255.1 hypothetical protein [Bacteroidaceae bacterium]